MCQTLLVLQQAVVDEHLDTPELLDRVLNVLPAATSRADGLTPGPSSKRPVSEQAKVSRLLLEIRNSDFDHLQRAGLVEPRSVLVRGLQSDRRLVPSGGAPTLHDCLCSC